MKTMPRFSSGIKLNNISARLWQNIPDELTRARNISSGPGIVVTDTAGGINISLAKPATTTSSADVMTVVVTRANVGDSVLLVREVQYADGIPVSGEYAAVGPAFEAHPAIGVSLDAFADSVTTGTPTIDSTFFTARRRSTIWFVDGPGGGGVGRGTIIAQFAFDRFFEANATRRQGADWYFANKLDADGLAVQENGRDKVFHVAFPYLLRRRPWDRTSGGTDIFVGGRKGILYEYGSASEREAGNGSVTERQTIVPAYIKGDIIQAAFRPSGPRVLTLFDELVNGQVVPGVVDWEEVATIREWKKVNEE